jgi:EpsD family peptidyl-prolyl cis-trans isomerase
MFATIRSPPGARPAAGLLVLGCVSLGLTACVGKGEDDTGAGSGSQVVAIVNDREIAVARMNEAPASGDPERAVLHSSKEEIESLVNEELLVQGALTQGLDRDAEVVQAIEDARRQVLVRYFAERSLFPKKAASDREIEDFYKSNPILFEHRKRIQLHKFSIEGIDLTDDLRAEIDEIHSLHALQDLLDKHDIKYRSEAAVLSTDQLPVDKLQEFAHVDVGDLLIAEPRGGRALLMFVTALEDDTALPLDRARPYIEKYLASARNRQAVKDYLRKEKALAKITYPRSAGGPERSSKVARSARESGASADQALSNEIAAVRAAANDAAP